MGLLSATRPKDLGVTDGRLKACPNKPNRVGSQADRGSRHYAEPLHFAGDTANAWKSLHSALAGMQRVAIIKDQPNCVRAEFTTRLMGYVDDTELYLDTGNLVIHLRSASRLGYRDLNVNRGRVEVTRQRFAMAIKA